MLNAMWTNKGVGRGNRLSYVYTALTVAPAAANITTYHWTAIFSGGADTLDCVNRGGAWIKFNITAEE